MTEPPYRPDIEEPPLRMRHLKIVRGYPLPWFVGKDPVTGKYDPRNKLMMAVNQHRCWVCGQPLRAELLAFVIGPMCAINRISSEPPSHLECAEYSARNCPFLAKPHMHRRKDDIPRKSRPGMIERNPGVVLVWITRKFELQRDMLFKLGDPIQTLWFSKGEPATRAEVEHSVETGKHLLYDHCRNDDDRKLLGKMELEA